MIINVATYTESDMNFFIIIECWSSNDNERVKIRVWSNVLEVQITWYYIVVIATLVFSKTYFFLCLDHLNIHVGLFVFIPEKNEFIVELWNLGTNMLHKWNCIIALY